MRTFQFSDAKSHKFWNIDVTGTSFTVAYGKVGTAGQTSSKTFDTPEKAQAEADKLVREKTGKGYAETTAKAVVSQDEALEQGLIADPHELVRWAAYSDYLTEQGDPRGEFMHVQLSLEDEKLTPAQRKALKKKEAELLKKHEKTWLGAIAELNLEADRYSFSRGWLNRLAFETLSVEQARILVKAPEARLLQELVVEKTAYEAPEGSGESYIDTHYAPGPDVPEDVETHQGPGLYPLCRVPWLKSVRVFTLGERSEQEYQNCHTPGDLAYHVVKQMPNIEELLLLAHNVDANKILPLPMPNLHVFELFHSKSYPLERLALNKTVTDLRVLRCHPHGLEYDDEEKGAYIRLAQLKAVCRASHWKNFTHLCLRLTDFGDAGAKEIVESGVLKRLKILDLQGGCISDKGAELLAKCPDLKNLESLNLRSNALTAVGIDKLKATGVKVDATQQHSDTSGGSDGDIAEYLFEGDPE
jgi:uncharacterized protein (TIGR02996 family)